MGNVKLYRDEQGRKLYPVCSWSANQHKLYNAYDRAQNKLYECSGEECETVERDIERIEHALDIFNSYVHNNLVYATYEDGLIIKDYVWAYNARH